MSPTTSPFGPLAVLLDPRAGHGVVAREVDAVEHALEARERTPLSGTLPTSRLEDGYERLQRLWRQIRRAEDAHEVQLCRELEPGFAAAAHAWAEGAALESILNETEMAPATSSATASS